MKKTKRLVSLFAACVALTFGSACSKTEEYFELPAFTENSDSGAYDSSLLYRNDLTLFGADASCLYVPEGRHQTEDGQDEYGGYYYMYPSATNTGLQGLIAQRENGQKEKFSDEGGTYFVTNPVYKSKDLVSWQLCGGVDGTFSTKIYDDEWAITGVMAPDPIYDPVTGKYYLYAQTCSRLKEDNPALYSECPSKSEVGKEGTNYYYWDRYFIGVYMADTPAGPFRAATSEMYYGDENTPNLNGKIVSRFNPPINIRYDLGLDIPWGVIDAHPFFDDDGQLYMYFCHHVDSNHEAVDIWGMKMKDMLTPDYSTMTLLIKGGYTTVTKNEKWTERPWSTDSYDMGEEYVLENGSHGDGNEGPFMMAKNYTDKNGNTVRRYFLMYSGGGYNNKYYDISQTISDNSPLGPFVKPKQYASSVVGTSYDNVWQMGCGHGSLVYSPSHDELFILGWSHTNDDYDAANQGRFYSVDKVHFIENEEYGLLLYGNGPTKSCQPKMYDYTGVRNIAGEAAVSVKTKGAYSGTEYLNDGLFVSHDYYKKLEFYSEKAVEITLTFAEPRSVRGILVYNTYDYNYAFSGIDYAEFRLAEKPLWYTAEKYAPVARVSDIKFSRDFIGTAYDYIESGAACLATFNEIKVNSITISVSGKVKENESYKGIKISDIAVLGE